MTVAGCVLTYNGAEIIDDVLSNCAPYYFELGVDVYYFDASEEDGTGKVIEKYRAQGYTNLYHLHMPNASSMERTNKMMSGELFNKKYDYIWPLKNRSFLSEEGLRDILMAMQLAPDVIVLAPQNITQKAFLKYTDPVLLYRDVSSFMTSLDTVIYNVDTIFDNYDTQEYYVGFNEFYSYVFNKMPHMEELNAVVINENISVLFNSSLGKSHYNVLDVWKEQWINVNDQLPECYNPYKDYVIKGLAKKPWLIGGMRRVYEFCQQGIIREDNMDDVRKDWERVSDVPIAIVEKIAKGEFEAFHDTSYIEDTRECNVLIGQIINYLKSGKMQISEIPVNQIYTIFKSEIQKEKKCGTDVRLIEGTIDDINDMFYKENITIEECCMYLQMYLSIGLLL